MSETLRLLMPQWQGGNNPPYFFGARLLSWLAPSVSEAVEAEVPVEPYLGTELPMEKRVVARTALLNQLKSATRIIESHRPERIITFGGDCLVSQAPFAYLNEKYGGNLLGGGDPEFAAEVQVPLKRELVMYGGLQKTTSQEAEVVERLNIPIAGADELAVSSSSVLDWLRRKRIRHLAVHLDLDVLDPALFRSLLFAKPEGGIIDSSRGTMTFAQISRLIQDIARETDIVGFTLAEYLPWDALNFHDFFK